MGAATADFRHAFLVYCLDQLPDGSYVALNRRYKPLGFVSTEWVDYEAHPVRFKFKRALSERQVVALSCKGDASAHRIYLYNDGCVPTASDAHWRAYSERLQRLAGYTLVI
jgi:hypothetical protein